MDSRRWIEAEASKVAVRPTRSGLPGAHQWAPTKSQAHRSIERLCCANEHQRDSTVCETSVLLQMLRSWIARPLHELTQKDVQFQWSTSFQRSFNQLKSFLIQSVILAYPDFSSVKELGAVLFQMQDDGKLRPVSYAS